MRVPTALPRVTAWLPLLCARHACFMKQDEQDGLPPGASVGDQLSEIVLKQARVLPDTNAQRSLATANLDAMLDSASSEMAGAFDSLTYNLSAVEQNCSAILSSELQAATSADIGRLDEAVASFRDSIIAPGRERLRSELASVREMEEERRNASQSLSTRSSWGRGDEWWQSKIAAGGPYVTVLDASSKSLGALLLLGLASPPLALGDAGGASPLTMLWRAVFALSMAAYLFSLSFLTQQDGEQ